MSDQNEVCKPNNELYNDQYEQYLQSPKELVVTRVFCVYLQTKNETQFYIAIYAHMVRVDDKESFTMQTNVIRACITPSRYQLDTTFVPINEFLATFEVIFDRELEPPDETLKKVKIDCDYLVSF
jgi:hypothetical protein